MWYAFRKPWCDVTNHAAQGELFGEENEQFFEEKSRKRRLRGILYGFLASLLRRVFAVDVLVCMHYAGKLRLAEIATDAAAIKRIIRDERRGRGEPVSKTEARGLPRGPPCQLVSAFR